MPIKILKFLIVSSVLLSTSLNAQIAKVTKLSPIIEQSFPDIKVNQNGSLSYIVKDSIVHTVDEGRTWVKTAVPEWYRIGSNTFHTKYDQLDNGTFILSKYNSVYLLNNEILKPIEISGDTLFTAGPWLINDEIYLIREKVLYAYNIDSESVSKMTNLDEGCYNCYEISASDDQIVVKVDNRKFQVFNNELELQEIIRISDNGTATGSSVIVSENGVLVLSRYFFDPISKWSTSISVSTDNGNSFKHLYTSHGVELDIIGMHNNNVYFRYFRDKWEAWSVGHHNSKLGSIDLDSGQLDLIYDGRNSKSNYDSYLVKGNLVFNVGGAVIEYTDADFSQRRVILNQSDEHSAIISKLKKSSAGTLYALSNWFLYKSKDDGMTWEMLLNHHTVVDFDITEEDRLYVISNDKIHQSDDEGASFEVINSVIQPFDKEFDYPYEIISVANGKLIVKAIGELVQQPNIDIGCHDCYVYHPAIIYTTTNNGISWRDKYVYSFDYPNITADNAYGMVSDVAINSIKYLRTEDEVIFTEWNQITSLTKSNLSRRHRKDLHQGYYAFSGLTIDGDLIINSYSGVSVSDNFGQTFTSLSSVPFGEIFTGTKSESVFVIDNLYGQTRQLYYLDNYKSPFVSLPIFFEEGGTLTEVLTPNQVCAFDEEVYIIATEGLFKLDQIDYFENYVTGVVYADKNSSCSNDNEDVINVIDLLKVEGQGFRFLAPVHEGRYNINLPDGEWSLTPIIKTNFWESCQSEYTSQLSGGLNSNVDIGLQAEEYCAYLTAHISNIRLRRCFETEYFINISNKGTESASDASVIVELDEFHDQVSFDIPFSELGNNRYQIEVGALTINQIKRIKMSAVISCDSPLGYSHCVSAEVTLDNNCTTAEVSESFYQENVGSYDPNDIRLFNEEGFEDRFFDIEEYQYYQIRFQNTGTDTAFTVRIEEEMDSNLDIETLEILSVSHEYRANIDFKNKMTILFDNILLPDSSTNLAASQGMISYRIKPKKEIDYGSCMISEANIYFDRNAPINTNNAVAIMRAHCETPIITEIDIEACGSYWGHRDDGRYRDVFNAVDGCDSIRFVNLKVLQDYEVQENVVLCDGEAYNGLTYYNSDDWDSAFYATTKRLQTVEGCDSIVNVAIEVRPYWDISRKYITICHGESYQGQTTSGIFFSNEESCTEISLTVLPSIDEEIDMTICAGESYLGHNITGSYTESVQDGECEGTKTLNLTVLEAISSEQMVDICMGESYESYDQSGRYVDSYISIDGCDSNRVLILNVLPISYEIINLEICAGTTYEGYAESGSYEDLYSAQNGCDSIRLLNLEVLQTNEVFLHLEVCEGSNIGGYTDSGTYNYGAIDENGCESIVELELIVHPNYTTQEEIRLCPGEDYNGHTEEGEYQELLTTTEGCDSIHTVFISLLNEDHIDCTTSSSEEIIHVNSEALIVMPNPTAGPTKLEIRKAINDEGTLKIYSIEKRKVFESKVMGTEIFFDLSEMEAGIYLINIQYQNRVFTSKVLKI